MLKKLIIFLCILALIGAGVYWFVLKDDAKQNETVEINTNEPLNTIEIEKGTKFKTFTAQEFSDLYNGLTYPNTRPIQNDFSMTGSIEADEVIYDLAEEAGYMVRSAPVTDNFVEIEDDQVLQRLAAEDWEKLNKQAEEDNFELSITQGFRSAENQNKIFMDRLGDINLARITDGSSDNKIKELLKTTAPPGYSRHHSGYTVDLACDSDPGPLFENSTCFEWISENNYINIKKYGWIPSYPEGIKNQGPEPESWEYVWVGLEAVKE